MIDVMTIQETAEIWRVSVRMVQKLCQSGKIEGAVKFGHSWMIPADAKKPVDGRIKSGKYIKGNRHKKLE